jgi:hypothetical protein
MKNQQENIVFTEEFILYMYSLGNNFEPNTLEFIEDDETLMWVKENGNTVAKIFVNEEINGRIVLEVEIDPQYNLGYDRICDELSDFLYLEWDNEDFGKIEFIQVEF